EEIHKLAEAAQGEEASVAAEQKPTETEEVVDSGLLADTEPEKAEEKTGEAPEPSNEEVKEQAEAAQSEEESVAAEQKPTEVEEVKDSGLLDGAETAETADVTAEQPKDVDAASAPADENSFAALEGVEATNPEEAAEE